MFENIKNKDTKNVLKSIVVLVDSREQKNSHIIDFFHKNSIKYDVKKLDCGDYSFYLPANSEIGVKEKINFEKDITIERKNSTNELVGNFASDKERIEREFCRHDGKMILMIEEPRFYFDLHTGHYRSKINEKSAIGVFHSLMDRYNIQVYFIDKELAGKFIYYHLYYYLRNRMKEEQNASNK